MKITLQNLCIVTLAILMTIAPFAQASAGVSGRLKGKVIDKITQEPLPNTIVRVEGTYFETYSDDKGEFAFIGIPAGTYDISISLETYRNVRYSQVSIFPDQISLLRIELEPASGENDEVIPEYPKLSFQINDPYAAKTLTSDQFSKKPYRKINDIVANTSGSIYQREAYQRGKDQFVRAGAYYEMGYYMNGFLLNDGFTGEIFSQIPYAAVDQIMVNLDGFEAKYGYFGSGITQIIPKRGGDVFSSSAEIVSDFAGSALGSESYGRNIYSLTFSGPIIKNTLHFFVAGELSKTDDAKPGVFGYPEFSLSPAGVINPDPSLDDTVIFKTDTDGNLVYKKGPAPNRVNSDQLTYMFGSLTYTPGASFQCDLTVLYSFQKTNLFSQRYLLGRNQIPHNERSTLSTGFSGKYFLSHDFFLTANLGYYSTAQEKIQRDLFSKGSDAILFVGPYLSGNTNGSSYYGDVLLYDIGQGFPFYEKSESGYLSSGLDFNWQWNKYNLFQTGFQTSYYSMRYFQTRSVSADPVNNLNNYYGYRIELSDDHYKLKKHNSGLDGVKEPILSHFFLQDELDWKTMRMTLGLRMDYFNTGTKELKDIYNSPGILEPQDFKNAKSFVKYSPRIAASAEVTEGLTVKGSYGLFYQIPAFKNYYTGTSILEIAYNTNIPLRVGNSKLKLQKSELTNLGVSYDYKKLWLVSVTRYWKNQKKVIGAGVLSGNPYDIYTYGNYDRASIRGVDVTVEGNVSPNFSCGLLAGFLSSDMSTTGDQSNFQADWLSYSPPQSSAPVDQEQKKTIKFYSEFRFFKNEGPVISQVHPLENMNLHVTGNWASGFPYTPTVIEFNTLYNPQVSPSEPHSSEQMPSTFSIDAKLTKQFDVSEMYHASVYIEVLNLLNRKNVINVFSATGKGDEDGYLTTAAGQSLNTRQKQQYQYILKNNSNYSNPRLVNMGLMLEF